MKASKRVGYSVIFALIVLVLAMFVEIVPCQKAPDLPNPKYTWSFCKINPDTMNQQGINKKYLGYTSSLTTTYIMVLVLLFIAALIVLHFTAKSKT